MKENFLDLDVDGMTVLQQIINRICELDASFSGQVLVAGCSECRNESSCSNTRRVLLTIIGTGEIPGSHGDEYEGDCLLWCYARQSVETDQHLRGA
jgi:hypothetical protein